MEKNSKKYFEYLLDSSKEVKTGKRSKLQSEAKPCNIWYDFLDLAQCFFKEKNPMPALHYDTPRADWSEKVACEVAKLLNLPVARYEFATVVLDGTNETVEGVISIDCFPIEKKIAFSNTGEELLEMTSRFNKSNSNVYTIENSVTALDLADVEPPSNWESKITGINTGAEVFVGYILLDALINNTDRHSDNWGVIGVKEEAGVRLELMPSFDHASSLGSNDRNEFNLSPSDYVQDHLSAFKEGNDDLSTLEVFDRAAKLYPDAAKIWLEQLSKVTPEQINEIFDRIPEERITPDAARFAIELLEFNRQELLLLYDKYLAESVGKYQEQVQANLDSLKAEITEYSDNPQLTFSEDTLSLMEEFVKDRLEKTGYPNPQNVVAARPVSEFDVELKQRLFKRVEENILELENGDNLWMLEAEIKQDMLQEGLIEQQNEEGNFGLITMVEDEEAVDEEGEDIDWHI